QFSIRARWVFVIFNPSIGLASRVSNQREPRSSSLMASPSVLSFQACSGQRSQRFAVFPLVFQPFQAFQAICRKTSKQLRRGLEDPRNGRTAWNAGTLGPGRLWLLVLPVPGILPQPMPTRRLAVVAELSLADASEQGCDRRQTIGIG